MNVSVRRVLVARFAANEQWVADVRRLLRVQLNYWQQPTIIDDAMLATTEVFTNAVRHGSKGPEDIVTVAFEVFSGDLRVSVTDSSTALPTPRDVSLLEDGGRGLHLLDAITNRWGAELKQDGAGKTVWFTIALASQQATSCPAVQLSTREAPRLLSHGPQQGWGPHCTDVILFEDTGDLRPHEQTIAPSQRFNHLVEGHAWRAA